MTPPVNQLEADEPGLWQLYAVQVRRDLLIVVRSIADVLNPLAFLFLAVTMFAFGLAGDKASMQLSSPTIVWVLVLLANLLALENLFRGDYEDGTLEQLVIHSEPLFLAVLGKITAHWLISGLLMVVLAPLAALMLGLPTQALATLLLTLLLGTPVLSLIGGIGAALTVGLGRSGVLLALIILPFYLPILLFATGAIANQIDGIDPSPQIYALAAGTLLAISLAPFAIVAGLRIGVEQ